MREVAEIDENKVSDLVLNNTTDVATPHTSQFDGITSMSEEIVGFDEVVNNLRRQLIGGLSGLDVISIVGMPRLEESWMLLKNKVFNTRSCPLVLEDVGQKIAQKCGGLPLSVVLVAGDNLSKWSSICSDVVKSKNGDVHHSNKEQDNEKFISNKEMEQA
ncbi:hypothetical protein T459_27207 [Capsicum annuum]|uniref:Uncharacterized protein n=1 Tax=Capsicum annuum TaxID=4072 RepID=A0A2G2YDA0_CAPAN|nr:hypothetical protein T459_27207 [Capsicum annuum]